MVGEGDPEVKEGVLPDPGRDYEEEKIRMKSAKALMTKKIKRLENALSKEYGCGEQRFSGGSKRNCIMQKRS